VVFASNRSWETLRKLINFDEHSRLGATVVDVSNLAAREEDLIAVLSSALADAAKRFTTWSAPLGISLAAWETIRDCRWRGNIRTLLRCVESSAIKWAMDPSAGEVIEATHFVDAINQWEPQPDDENAKLYL